MTDEEIRNVVHAGAFRHGVRASDVLGPRRYRELVKARMLIAKELRGGGLSLHQIGRVLRRDHSTVVSLIAGGKHKRPSPTPASATPPPPPPPPEGTPYVRAGH